MENFKSIVNLDLDAIVHSLTPACRVTVSSTSTLLPASVLGLTHNVHKTTNNSQNLRGAIQKDKNYRQIFSLLASGRAVQVFHTEEGQQLQSKSAIQSVAYKITFLAHWKDATPGTLWYFRFLSDHQLIVFLYIKNEVFCIILKKFLEKLGISNIPKMRMCCLLGLAKSATGSLQLSTTRCAARPTAWCGTHAALPSPCRAAPRVEAMG